MFFGNVELGAWSGTYSGLIRAMPAVAAHLTGAGVVGAVGVGTGAASSGPSGFSVVSITNI